MGPDRKAERLKLSDTMRGEQPSPVEQRGTNTELRLDRRLRASPGPVVIQRRAQAARHARASATAVRIGVLLCVDLVVISLGYSIVDFLRSPASPSIQVAALLVDLVPRGTLPRVEVVLAVVLGLAVLGNYGPGPFRKSASRLFGGASLGLSVVFWSRIWDGASVLGTLGFVLALVGLGTLLLGGRSLVQYFVAAVRPTLNRSSRAVVIGSAAQARQMRGSAHLRNDSPLSIVGHIPTTAAHDPDGLGCLGDLLWILELYAIDTVMVADLLDEESLLAVLKVCDDTGCTAIAASPSPLGGFVPRVVSIGYTPYVELYRPSLRAPQLAIKRIFDVAVASLLMLLLLPFLALVALCVAVTSPGPVIFSQDRIGYAGRRFRIHKFRTMVKDAEQRRDELKSESLYDDERVFKVLEDPRVTRLGRILRRTSIDELPQLWNVLQGEMSLVGPRPPLPDEVERYEEHHYARFDMKPGITGPWQVAGRNNVTCFDQIIALDNAYLTDWTIGKDFVLLLKTIPAVLSMRGAV